MPALARLQNPGDAPLVIQLAISLIARPLSF